MNNPANKPPLFVTYPCQHCNGHIEFDACHAGESAACPHCGLETKLYVPKPPAAAPAPGQVRATTSIAPKVVENKPQNVSVEIKRGINPLGIAALVLGIGACVFCWIPFLGLLALPLAVIGLLLAAIGITAAIVGKKSSLSFPVGGAVICIVAILVALFVTGGISTMIAKHEIQSDSTNQKTESSSSEGDWSKSSAVQQGDLRIEVETTSNLHFWPNNYPRTASYLDGFFKIKLTNLSNTKKIDFTTWRGKTFGSGNDYATLSDDNGNSYKLESSDFSQYGQQDDTSIYPNKSYEDFLNFEKPVSQFKWLHLELPAENFGGSGMIRFEIPATN